MVHLSVNAMFVIAALTSIPFQHWRKWGKQPCSASIRGTVKWLLPCLWGSAVDFACMAIAVINDERYLAWAKSHTTAALPDVMLDNFGSPPDQTHLGWESRVANFLSPVTLIAAYCFCAFSEDSEMWFLTWMVDSLLMALRQVVQTVTVMPSSLGYAACVQYLGRDRVRLDSSFANPQGGCSAMLWSGHTFHAMLCAFTICSVLSRRWKGLVSGPVSPRIVIAFVSGLIMGTLKVLAHEHYSVDVVVALIVGTLTLTHQGLLGGIQTMYYRIGRWSGPTNELSQNLLGKMADASGCDSYGETV